MRNDVGPLILYRRYHAVGILSACASRPAEFVYASDADIHESVVELLKVEGAVGVKDIEFGTYKQSDAVHLTRYDVGITEIDWLYAAWYRGSVVGDAKYL